MRRGDVLAGRFELQTEAGAGGMGAVWRALDRSTGDDVALKLLESTTPENVARFGREASVLAGLSHPAIVRYIAHGHSEDGRLFIAMEWLDGQDLGRRLLTGAPPSVAECIALLRQVSHALALAHGHGVIHRDIKPGNLFLPDGSFERVKVLDFGVARFAEAPNQITRTGVSVGTPGYMAPEQARGLDLDARADVFSLGCVVFECLAGRPAFRAEHVIGVLAKVLFEDLLRVSHFRQAVPSGLDALVGRMLAKDPDVRPADGSELVRRIAELGPIEETGAGRPTESESLTRTEQRVFSVVVSSAGSKTAAATPASPWHGTLVQADLAAIRNLVRTFDGEVEVLGDGSVIATLSGSGAPTELATRAARCALAVHRASGEMPVVLATGRGVIGARLPVGEVIDRAVTLLQFSGRGGVGIDDVTAELLDTRFEIVGDRGKRVLTSERSEAEAARILLGKPTPCVGRERELSILETIWEQCVSDQTPGAVLISGPAGIGKSRLRFEFVRTLKERYGHVSTMIAHADAMVGSGTFGMLAPLVRRVAGILEGEPLEAQRDKFSERIGRYMGVQDRDVSVAFLGELAGVPFDEDAAPQLRAARMDPVLMGELTRQAWETWIRAEASVSPLVLMLENLHWADLPSVRYTEAILQDSNAPVMVVALSRSEVHERFPRLWSGVAFTEIRLRGLSKRASEELVRTAVDKNLRDSQIMRIVERSDGNAFHLEELIRAAAEDRGDALPETVLGMVQTRLDALDVEARRVLRAASVFGRMFWRGGVEALLGGSPSGPALDSLLDSVLNAELLMRRRNAVFPGEDEYVFRHDLVRDAAYAMLTDKDSELGHRLAGRWLETMGSRDSAVLAEHFERGRDNEAAVEHYHRAATDALEACNLDAAVDLAERGIACGARGETLGALRLIQCEVHNGKLEFARAAKCIVEAIHAFSPGSPMWYRALGEQAQLATPLRQKQTTIDTCIALRDTRAANVEAATRRVISIGLSAPQLVLFGEYALAAEMQREAERDVEVFAITEPLAIGRLHMARAFIGIAEDDRERVAIENERGVDELKRGGFLRSAVTSGASLGFALLELGDIARAEEVLEEARQSAERIGLEYGAKLSRVYLLLALSRRGDVSPAVLRAELLKQRAGTEDSRIDGSSQILLGQIVAAAGDLKTAEAYLVDAIEKVRVFPPVHAWGLAVLATIVLRQGRAQEALDYAELAMELLRSLGTLFVGEAIVRLVWAEALEATGARERAAEALVEAWARLKVRSERIANPERRRSFLEGVPENARTVALARERGIA